VLFALLNWRVAHFREDIASRKVEAGTLGHNRIVSIQVAAKRHKNSGAGRRSPAAL